MGVLRDRMADELRIRGYSARTIIVYLQCVKLFVKYFNKSPETLGKEEIFQYQKHLVERGVSWGTFNLAVCSLRFFYNRVLKKNWLIKHIPFQKKDLSCHAS